MDTVEERSENLSFDDQIKIVNDLEQYIFEKIYSNLAFRAKIHNQRKLDHLNLVRLNYTIFDKSVVCQPVSKIQVSTPLNSFKLIHSNTQILKNAIYHLYDHGLFKESEEDRIRRLCNKPVKAVFANNNGEDDVNKLDFEYLPKHYHEIISNIKSYRSAIETKNYKQAHDLYKILLREVTNHSIGYIPKLLPINLRKSIEQIKHSYLSQESDEIKEKAYIDFVAKFIKKYEHNHAALWDKLNFSRQDQEELKELSANTFQLIAPFKTKFAIRKLKKNIHLLKPKKIVLFEKLINYLNKEAEEEVREILRKNYELKENTYIKNLKNIDLLLRTFIKKNPTKSSRAPIYDPYLFTPHVSIHSVDALNELKTNATRNKSAKMQKKKAFQTQKHLAMQPKRNFIGDTDRMLKTNKDLYQSLLNLLNG